jgi:hypothetical protein
MSMHGRNLTALRAASFDGGVLPSPLPREDAEHTVTERIARVTVVGVIARVSPVTRGLPFLSSPLGTKPRRRGVPIYLTVHNSSFLYPKQQRRPEKWVLVSFRQSIGLAVCDSEKWVGTHSNSFSIERGDAPSSIVVVVVVVVVYRRHAG